MKTMMIYRKKHLAVAVALMACGLSAAPHVTIDHVAQRWPWNNNVDITYTVAGAQDVSSGTYMKLVFNAKIDDTTYSIDGGALGASASAGTHTVTWRTAPAGVKTTTLSMSATIYPSAVPSGDDYMIVDLSSGEVTYEGLFARQEDSNARYNTAEYKSGKMAFRKVPAGGPYPTGDSANFSVNSNKTWTTLRDYYVSIFLVTQDQFVKLGLSNPVTGSASLNDDGTDIAKYRPVTHISWNNLRGSTTSSQTYLGENANGTFFERLNARTRAASGITAFDLPSEVMFEIAGRAGATTKYIWGPNPDSDHIYSYAEKPGIGHPYMVGSYKPNAWGLYDMSGNVWEWMRDDASRAQMHNATGAFDFAWNSNSKARVRGGGIFQASPSDNEFRASHRNEIDRSLANRWHHGFRVAWIRQ